MLGDTPNAPVVWRRSRRFPGVLIQGDTLSSLVVLAERGRAGDRDALEQLTEDLHDLLEVYERALERYGIRRPYVR
ncbi:MAG: hypothetical protein R3F62_29005 [Planctomycetota bacterium]